MEKQELYDLAESLHNLGLNEVKGKFGIFQPEDWNPNSNHKNFGDEIISAYQKDLKNKDLIPNTSFFIIFEKDGRGNSLRPFFSLEGIKTRALETIEKIAEKYNCESIYEMD
jgi:hypothetical protein